VAVAGNQPTGAEIGASRIALAAPQWKEFRDRTQRNSKILCTEYDPLDSIPRIPAARSGEGAMSFTRGLRGYAVGALVSFALILAASPSRAQDVSDFDEAASSTASAKINLSNFQAASVVIGQADFTGNSANQGGTAAANTINDPYGNASRTQKGLFYVPDYSNNRVLGFLAIPSTNNASADFVLGQPDLTSTGTGDNADQMHGPETTAVNKTMLLVDEYGNSRVLIWKKAPTSNAVPADIVVGQAGFGTNATACAAVGLSNPESIAVAKGKLVVGDSNNNRVLIWKKIPTTNGQLPDLILGQNNSTTCVKNNNGSGASGAPSAGNFDYPAGVWTDGKRLVVADGNNNRVLIWKKFPKSSFQPANVVLGQLDFTTNAKNNDGSGGVGVNPSKPSLNFPYYLIGNGSQVFVADNGNNRVLVWNNPKKNFQPADVVLGQPNFTCGLRNNDGSGCVSGAASAKNLDNPRGFFVFKKQLVVTDGGNNRYLIFN
jgi:hypothetical protein